MNRNYECPRVSPEWAGSRNTHPAVAAAIHAIAGPGRSAESIWAAPTSTEWGHVEMAVAEYLRCDDWPAEADGRYQWGDSAVEVPA